MIDQCVMSKMINNTIIAPRLQILDCRMVKNSNQTIERTGLILSDGHHYIQGFISNSVLLEENGSILKKFTIIRLKEYQTHFINEKNTYICIIKCYEILDQMSEMVGKPMNISKLNVKNGVCVQNHRRRSGNIKDHIGNNNKNIENRSRSRSRERYNQVDAQPIASLNPYRKKWKICVRCTNKTDIKHYSNQKGQGKLFDVDLLDDFGTEIKAVIFNDCVDMFYDIFKEQALYMISNGTVKLTRKGYSHIKNEYNIILNHDTKVIQLKDNHHFRHQTYNFIKIKQLQQKEVGLFVDIIGIIIDSNDIESVMNKKTHQMTKLRKLTIIDNTASINLTLWGKYAEKWNKSDLKNSVIVIKGCKINGYGGRSLSASNNIKIAVEYIQEAQELKNWFKLYRLNRWLIQIQNDF